MKLLHFFTSVVLFCLLTAFIVVAPINTVLTHENTKETLHTINLYDRIVSIIARQWLSFNPILNPDDQLFEVLVRDHATEIVSSEWVGTVGDQFLDEVFYAMKHDDGFSNFTVDLAPVKENFIQILQVSDIKEDIPKLESQIPDSIPVTLLIGLDLRQMNYMIVQFEELLTMFDYLKNILLVLLVAPLVVYFLIGSLKEMADWSMRTVFATSLPFLIFPFIFQLLILSKSGIELLTKNYASFRETVLVLVGLSFIEQMMHTWTVIALGLFAISSLYLVWFKIYKKINIGGL